LRQRGDEKTLKEDLKLNDQELKEVFSLSQLRGVYSEFYLQSETIRGVFRYRPTPLELWLSTTHPPDNALLEKKWKEHPYFSCKEIPSITWQKTTRSVLKGLQHEAIIFGYYCKPHQRLDCVFAV